MKDALSGTWDGRGIEQWDGGAGYPRDNSCKAKYTDVQRSMSKYSLHGGDDVGDELQLNLLSDIS